MKKEIDITKSCEWLGEFWYIENEKSKYHGILSYAPKGEIYECIGLAYRDCINSWNSFLGEEE